MKMTDRIAIEAIPGGIRVFRTDSADEDPIAVEITAHGLGLLVVGKSNTGLDASSNSFTLWPGRVRNSTH